MDSILNRLSILHVLAPGDAGGLETVVRLLAVGQRDHGHAVRVATIVARDGAADHPYVRSLVEAGVEVIPLALPMRAYFRERALVAELCCQFQPSIVHTHGYRADVVDSGVARRFGVPRVTTVHGFAGGGWRNRFYERLQRRAFRRFDAVVAVSRQLAHSLAACGVQRDRIHVVPNAYAPAHQAFDRTAARRHLGIPDDQFTMGWVGRLSPEKGCDIMLDAVARLSDVPLRVSVLGDGTDRRNLARRAATLGIADRVTWHGVVHGAAAFFRAFDLFVLSSRTEGSPMVLFEAMSAGVPIVAASVGGVPDVLSPDAAVLVPAEDSAALARAIHGVYHDRARMMSRVHAAHERLRSFDSATWLAQYEMLYRQLQRRLTETPG